MDLFGKNAGEVVGGQVGLHDLDLLAMWVFAHTALLVDVFRTGLTPISLVSGFCGLWSE